MSELPLDFIQPQDPTEPIDDFIPIDVMHSKGFEGLNPIRQIGAIESANLINWAVAQGVIDPRRPMQMLDWGTAEGGTALPLIELGRRSGGSVTAVEATPQAVRAVIESGILPEESIHLGEGVTFLHQATDAGINYDLITACMFGGDFEGRLARRFLPAALANLSDIGKLMVFSDFHTMTDFEVMCNRLSVSYQSSWARLHPSKPERRIITASQQATYWM